MVGGYEYPFRVPWRRRGFTTGDMVGVNIADVDEVNDKEKSQEEPHDWFTEDAGKRLGSEKHQN